MTVRTLLEGQHERLITCTPENTIAAVAAVLAENRIGAMPVIGGGGDLVGIISERDVVHGVARFDVEALAMAVRELMTSDVAVCGPDDPVKDVMALMSRRHIRHLPVVEGGRVRSMLSQPDVMQSRLDETRLEADVLRERAIAAST